MGHGRLFPGRNTPEETQRAAETFRTICQSSVQNEGGDEPGTGNAAGNAQAEKVLEQMADESPVKMVPKAVTEARKGDNRTDGSGSVSGEMLSTWTRR